MKHLKPFARKPETLALLVALIGTLTVLTVFLADLLLARKNDIDAGERRLQHFGLMMAEHTARTFEAVDVLLRETATDLAHNRNEWERWEASTGWEYIAQRHSRAMPQLRDLIIFDRRGNQRFISTYFPPPSVNVRDRPYFAALEGGAEIATYGPYVGRNSGRYTYAISRRISTHDGVFAGAVFAAIEPAYLQDFCWSNRLADEFESVLANARGEIVASCRPADLSRQSPILGARAEDVLFNGKLRGQIPNSGIVTVGELLVAVAPVPGFSDLRIVTVIPEQILLASWHSRLVELGTVALLVCTVLVVGTGLIRRQIRDMAEMTSELAAGHEHLEERVRAATQELAGQKDAAVRANKAKSRFLAAASHDLRQPLHALSLFAADLQRQLKRGSTEDLPRIAGQISASTAALGELLDSLLDISRLDVAGIRPERTSFALMPMFERLAASLRRAAADNAIQLRFRPTLLWADTDPMMLERMLSNLISNAIQYTPTGGRVLVVARRRKGKIRVEVRDNGIGIAKEHQQAIFDEFYQVGNQAREHDKGLGLGLSIVDRLARALGVRVSLRSRLCEGTVFAVTVPPGKPRIEAPANESTVGNKVHCIGDSAVLHDGARLMRGWGYDVETGGSADRLPLDAVIVTDNANAAAVNHARAPETPLVVLGAEGGSVPAGAHGIAEPVRPARLRALLGQLQKTFSKSMP